MLLFCNKKNKKKKRNRTKIEYGGCVRTVCAIVHHDVRHISGIYIFILYFCERQSQVLSPVILFGQTLYAHLEYKYLTINFFDINFDRFFMYDLSFSNFKFSETIYIYIYIYSQFICPNFNLRSLSLLISAKLLRHGYFNEL